MSEVGKLFSYGSPIYVIGRQHSGNTMMATLLERHPDVYLFAGEGGFFEHLSSIRGNERSFLRVLEEVEGRASSSVSKAQRGKLVEFLKQKRNEGSPASHLYALGRKKIAEFDGKTRWVQQATSYIFYINDILNHIPSSRLIYLFRNPLDIAASNKRRGDWKGILRMVWGWNRGVRIARTWKEDERFLSVRYEDLVREPESELRRICSFADLEFKNDLLEVPHVNRSETPYNTASQETGLKDSRVYYYRDVLSPEEEAVVRTWIDSELLTATYPDIPDARDHQTGRRLTQSVTALGGMVHTLFSDHMSELLHKPRYVLDRVRRRL